jgi:oligopeptide transport system substrate-binding protein
MIALQGLFRARAGLGVAALAALPLLGLLLLPRAQLARADVVFNNGGEIATLDPHAGSGVPEGRVARALFEGLVTRNPMAFDLPAAPAAAESWEFAPDGLSCVFRLRPGLAWSNGDPLTAADFEWSFRRMLSPETAAPFGHLLDGVTGAADFRRGLESDWGTVGIRALDESSLEFRLDVAMPLLDVLAHHAFVPVHRPSIELARREHPGTWQIEWLRPERLVVNGPFRVRERRINDRLRLERNPRYWDGEHVALDTLDVLAVEQRGTALNLYLAGAVDWLDGTLPPDLIPVLAAREDFRGDFPYLGVYFYRFNVTRPPFDDARVRRAFTAAIDRDAIAKELLGGRQRPALSFTPASWRGYSPPRMALPNAEEQLALFEQAGYGGENRKPFPRVAIHFNDSELHRGMAELIAAGWTKTFGVPIGLAPQEQKLYLDAQRNLDYDVSRSSWIGDTIDPAGFLDIWQSDNENNRTGWINPEYDRLIAQARASPDPAERIRLLVRAEKILLTELPCAPIYFYNSQNMVSPRLGGFGNNLLNDQSPKNWYWMDDQELRASRAALSTGKAPVAEVSGPRRGKYSAAAAAARAAAKDGGAGGGS